MACKSCGGKVIVPPTPPITTLPTITEDQYLVLEYIPSGVASLRPTSQYEPSIRYYFSAPPESPRSLRENSTNNKKVVVNTIEEIVSTNNPSEIYYGDALALIQVKFMNKNIFRFLIMEKDVEEVIVEEPIVEEVVEPVVEMVSEAVVKEVTVEEIVEFYNADVSMSISKMKTLLETENLDIPQLLEDEVDGKNRAGMIELLEANL